MMVIANREEVYAVTATIVTAEAVTFVNTWPDFLKENNKMDIMNNAWVTLNNNFLATSEAICLWF